MKKVFLIVLAIVANFANSQTLTPEVTSWIINTNNQTGYGSILTNVQKVQYTSTDVYVSSTCIPGYDIGPWTGNPNTPANQNFVFKITRSPKKNTGTLTATQLGHIGVWSNGVSIFNAKDARSYNNAGVWNQNAIYVEGKSFDTCLGHPAPNGEYHHHLNPHCLYDDKDNSKHSPIIGYAFDGFPIYGAYGYKNADGSGGISRMRSSYALRNITKRTTLPNGSTASSAGPDVAGQYALGYYVEDFAYTAGMGDLDDHNGRFCVTPDYPNGIYAYFVTLDSNGTAAYPYIVGPDYYGVVPSGNTGPQSGHNTVPNNATTYTKTNTEIGAVENSTSVSIYPNPSQGIVYINFEKLVSNIGAVYIYNSMGEIVNALYNISPNQNYSLDMTLQPKGIYYIKISDGYNELSSRFIINN